MDFRRTNLKSVNPTPEIATRSISLWTTDPGDRLCLYGTGHERKLQRESQTGARERPGRSAGTRQSVRAKSRTAQPNGASSDRPPVERASGRLRRVAGGVHRVRPAVRGIPSKAVN